MDVQAQVNLLSLHTLAQNTYHIFPFCVSLEHIPEHKEMEEMDDRILFDWIHAEILLTCFKLRFEFVCSSFHVFLANLVEFSLQ